MHQTTLLLKDILQSICWGGPPPLSLSLALKTMAGDKEDCNKNLCPLREHNLFYFENLYIHTYVGRVHTIVYILYSVYVCRIKHNTYIYMSTRMSKYYICKTLTNMHHYRANRYIQYSFTLLRVHFTYINLSVHFKINKYNYMSI